MIELLYGEEKYLLETHLKKIKKEFGELEKGINYIQIDSSNILTLIDEALTPSFMYEKKLIIASNTGLFKKAKRGTKTETEKNEKTTKTKEKKSTTDSDKIIDFLNQNKDLFEESVDLIFVEEDADKNKIYKIIDELGKVTKFDVLNLSQLITKLSQICKGYKIETSNDTLKYLVESCGGYMLDLINELRKLIEYTGEGGKITRKEVDMLCIKKIESVIFELTDNLGKKNINEALNVLNNLIYNKEPIQRILVMLYNHFKKIYLTKMAMNENIDLVYALNLKPNQVFLTSKYRHQASYFKNAEIRNVLNALVDLDANYKIGKIDLNIGLESILCMYCS